MLSKFGKKFVQAFSLTTVQMFHHCSATIKAYTPTSLGRWFGKDYKWTVTVNHTLYGEWRTGDKVMDKGKEVTIVKDGITIECEDVKLTLDNSWHPTRMQLKIEKLGTGEKPLRKILRSSGVEVPLPDEDESELRATQA